MKTFLAALLMCCGCVSAHAQSDAGANAAQSSPSAAAATDQAQQSQQPQTSSQVLRVQTTLVTVPTLVRDKHGHHVWALTANDFAITDDGVPQRVRLDESPIPPERAIAIVVEDSSAMELLAASLGPALVDFLNALPDGDIPITVLMAGARVNIALPFTSDREVAIKRMRYVVPDRDEGGPQILDAVYRAAELLQTAYPKRQKIILLVSGPHDGDSAAAISIGFDRLQGLGKKQRTAWRSAHESEEVLSYLEANNIVVDAIEISRLKLGWSDYWKDADRAAIALNPISLLAHAGDWVRKDVPRSLAAATGGEVQTVARKGKVSGDALHIAADVPALYALSFRPQNPQPGLHHIRVSVPGRPVSVRAREFYWVNGTAQQTGVAEAPAASP